MYNYTTACTKTHVEICPILPEVTIYGALKWYKIRLGFKNLFLIAILLFSKVFFIKNKIICVYFFKKSKRK